MSSGRVPQGLIRIAAVVLIAAAAQACSDLPEWMGGDPAPAQPVPTSDTTASAPDTSGSQGTTVAEASDQYPVLADTPSKAPPTTSSDEQKQVANGLVADRTQAQYSADALQAGNVAAAEPPPPASAESAVVPPPDTAPASTTPASAASTPQPAPAATRTASAEPEGRSPMPGTLPAEGESAAPAADVASAPPSVSTAPPPPPAPATAASPPPAAPPPPRVAAAAPSVAAEDAALGFQPSHAPPLDPAVAQLMGNRAPARMQRYASLNTSSAPARSTFQPSGTPTAVVPFAANTIALDANGIAQVQAAVAAYKAAGGTGYVRVVGHSASGGPTLSADKQMTQSLQRSQACATAVARELIKEGVPANRVLVDAAASLSENEQRRAEIFLQS